ncbi:MAG: hypothetical protein JOY57_05845 [Actinobacteria bacterium]|nr:hypothetical protein [Actinomycetota bacterium]MBV8960071.1 hypothetical protein [Actinomycetota bacterium]
MPEQSTVVTPPDAPSPPSHTQSTLVVGCISAAMAIWLLPYVFGPLGMICGGMAVVRGDRRGRWVIALAAVCLVIGLLVNLVPDHILFSGS